MSLCTHAVLVNQGNGQARANILRCRSWSCEHCFPARKAGLIAKAADGKPQRLLTFTIDPKNYTDPNHAAVELAHAWRRLARRIVQQQKVKKLDYFCVFEAHKSGWPHLHILQRGGFIAWGWLVEEWMKLTGARGVDIRFIYDPAQCAGYVAKYIGKNPHRFAGVKRYWCSRTWQLTKWIKPDDVGAWSKLWETRECTLSDLRDRWQITFPYTWFEGETLYGGTGPPEWAIDIKGPERWPEL